MKHITLPWLSRHELHLKQISLMSEEDIRTIWIKPSEDKSVDLSTITYNYDIPLYQKMIFRFRQCSLSAPRFFQQIDPGNQQVMLCHFVHNYVTIKELQELMEFMAWISNGLGIYDVTRLEFNEYSEELVQQSTFVKLWQANQVTFFFGLSEEKKLELLKRYNIDCVDSYNQLINADKLQEMTQLLSSLHK